MFDILSVQSVLAFVETYVSVSYILAVVFGTDVLNKLVPFFKKVDNRIAATLVPLVIAFLFYFLQSPENKAVYAEKIFVSFLCAVAMYDFLIKPIRKLITKKLSVLQQEDADKPKDSQDA